MTNNPAGDRGTIALAEALRAGALPSLTALYLTNVDMGDQGCAAITDALRDESALQKLKSLDLFSNARISPVDHAAVKNAALLRGIELSI